MVIGIDWTEPTEMVSKYFTVKECLWLPKLKRLATMEDGLTDELKDTIYFFAERLDMIRDYLGHPMKVHSFFRPPAYSLLIGGHASDVHTKGVAIDFDCNPHLSCDQVKNLLLPKLAYFDLRMEDNGIGANWVHLDGYPVVHSRFFKP